MRTLAFGDLAAGMWGATWGAGEGAPEFVCLGARDAVAVLPARVEGEGPGAPWRLVGDGVSLTITALADSVTVLGADGEAAGFEQLCRAEGRFTVDGAEHEAQCLARRGERSASLDGLDSLRDVSALFEPADGLALVSLRPRKGRGHDRDAVTAAVLDTEGSGPVADPRFSTTYDAGGWPLRASFELWLGDAENEYPRRAAGAALGPRVSAVERGLNVQASLFRWDSRGREGAGVYIVARPA